MPLTAEEIAQQQKQAEEILGPQGEKLGFAKALFFGHFNDSLLFPYPELRAEDKPALEQILTGLREAFEKNFIPQDVIALLGRLGVLGLTAPASCNGKALSQQAACRVMELIGGHDAGLGVFVNAHHSIGIRALLLFGTEEQKQRWLPDLVSGAKLAAFALTEPEAGSDAANVQTTATPTPDGKAYILNGNKQYITNGGIAGVLTVMARTPNPAHGGSKITAFLVTPDMPGFQVIDARMPKVGIRGTATAKLAFKDMAVPAENVLGQVGKGLKVALTVLDFGRTTFGATCTGVAKECLKAAVRHAKTRVQFKQPLAEFELVKKKIAHMAACAFAMEATVSQCAAFIDRGAEDYMVETAMLKVWSTDVLWQIVNDTIQIYGGKAYFTDQPFERWMRDARINTIGEGANDVLRSFIALVGMRGVGEKLKEVLEAMHSPWQQLGKLWSFGKSQIEARLVAPTIKVHAMSTLSDETSELSKRVRDFGLAVQSVLRQYRESVLTKQYAQERIADAACDLYASACTLSRLDHMLSTTGQQTPDTAAEVTAGRYFLKLANRRIQQNLASLWDNDDEAATGAANAALGRF
jgi:acyl-CoA dehydrogenase family member 9